MNLLDVRFPPEFDLVRWPDRVVETVGFPAEHAYVELLYLPVIGPSATLIFRRLGSRLRACPDGTRVDLVSLSGAMGLGDSIGANSIIQRSLRRLLRFGLASWQGRLALRTAVPPLTERHVARLHPDLQAMHVALVAGNAGSRNCKDAQLLAG